LIAFDWAECNTRGYMYYQTKDLSQLVSLLEPKTKELIEVTGEIMF